MSRFTMLQDVPAPEMQSVYAAGMSYTIQSPAAVAEQCKRANMTAPQIEAAVKRAELLPGLGEKWVAEGKATFGAPGAEVAGVGAAADASKEV